jgi:RHS repeat-associated protein
VQPINSVKVWNRADCCTSTTRAFYVLVSDAPFASTNLSATLAQAGVSHYYVAGAAGAPTTLTVGRTGRYVRVQLAGTNYLTLSEVEVLGNATVSTASVQWIVTDHLGTPRMVADLSGSLSSIRRHDYLPFGEEVGAGVGGRTAAQGYAGDNVRQKFTSKERDTETGLDYFLARYYSSTQGRFTSPDEFQGGPRELFVLGSGHSEKQALPYAEVTQPQSLNKYTYVYNNPCRYVDPDGHCGTPSGLKPGQVGICVASYISGKTVPKSLWLGAGDGRGPNGQGGTSRIEVRVAVDVKEVKVTKTDETMGTSGILHKEAGFKGTGGVQVSSPNTDEKGNVYFQINQHATSTSPAALWGSIDNHLNMVVTTDGRVGVTPSSTAKDYPSLEVFKYTVDDKGKVTTTMILDKKESGNIGDLSKPEKPIKANLK